MAIPNTDLRLKAVLDLLSAAATEGLPVNAGTVLAEALLQVPPTPQEAELLSGGIPRGHKNLTTATARLVKAGWMVKGRSGWSATELGQRATVAFPTAQRFAEALAAGTPVPEGTPLPKPAPKKRPTRAKAAPESGPKSAAQKSAAPKRTRKSTAEVAAVAEAPSGAEPAAGTTAAADVPDGQPRSVALAGDFATHLGAGENWNPATDVVQMAFDPAELRWKLAVDLPAGRYEYKVVLENSWEENYGAFGVRDGANHELEHAGGTVLFAYDHNARDVVVA